MAFFKRLFKDANQVIMKQVGPIVTQINALSAEFEKLSPEQLKAKTAEFRQQLKDGKILDDLLVPAFAVAREANRRAINVRHFDVQLVGGVVLHKGSIAEMKTGEGKTHVASLALYLNALKGEGAHLVTVNDYLAKRDCGWNGPANDLLGIKTACLTHEQAFIFDPDFIDEKQKDERLKHMRPCPRPEAYLADITYGTNSEFGFDYLRDNMVANLDQQVQRPLAFAIVDEVDSILIDEARTPLIISAPAEESGRMYQQFAQLVPRLKENEDYNVDEKMRASTLTEVGLERVEKMLGMGNIYTEGGIQLVHHLEQALKAHALFKKDRDYVVKDDQIIIIDEFTGRLMEGRRYSEGLHQAIEAKEGVSVQRESRTLATITIQNYFRLYKKLSGMTGTAATEKEEFTKIYGLDVVTIPTNQPMVRKDLSDRIYATEQGKFKAVVNEIKRIQSTGQPVLVGTVSIEKNELLSLCLRQAGVPHEILNAKQHEKEAEILAQAGRVGAVTVATNMAGRGVDIILGGTPFNKEEYEKVKALGGLFVLGTERHEARRIDNQLRGRSGRQGDPGQSQFCISMEDDLMRIFGSDRVKNMMIRLGVPEEQALENKMISNSIEKAQKRVEGHNFDIRKHLVEYDDVMNKQREVIYKRRRTILQSAQEDPQFTKPEVLRLVEDELEQVVSFHTAGEEQAQWNLKEIGEVARTIFPLTQTELDAISNLEKIAGDRQQDAVARTEIIEYLIKLAKGKYEALEASVENQATEKGYMRLLEQELLIRSIDNLWVDHLEAVDSLRAGIGLRGYGQHDPLVEYKKETYRMFIQLQNLIQRQVVYSIYKLGYTTQLARSVMETDRIQQSGAQEMGQFEVVKSSDPYAGAKHQESAPLEKKLRNVEGEKVGRNDACPCGAINPATGKIYKYKHCGLINAPNHKN